MIQECSRQIRPTALIASALSESQAGASYLGARLPKAQLEYWCFAGGPTCGCLCLLSLSGLTHILEEWLLEKERRC